MELGQPERSAARVARGAVSAGVTGRPDRPTLPSIRATPVPSQGYFTETWPAGCRADTCGTGGSADEGLRRLAKLGGGRQAPQVRARGLGLGVSKDRQEVPKLDCAQVPS